MVSRLTVLITKMDELELTDDEIADLQGLWAPVLPSFPPLMAALLATSFIVAGKYGLYITLKRQREGQASKAPDVEAIRLAALERQVEGANDGQVKS